MGLREAILRQERSEGIDEYEGTNSFGDGRLRKFLIVFSFLLSKSAKNERISQKGWPRF